MSLGEWRESARDRTQSGRGAAVRRNAHFRPVWVTPGGLPFERAECRFILVRAPRDVLTSRLIQEAEEPAKNERFWKG
jgi:hypothetical protein